MLDRGSFSEIGYRLVISEAPKHVSRPELIQINEIPSSERGSLFVAECEQHVPFDIKRLFFMTDVPKNSHRGGHAHIALKQFAICIQGSITIETVSHSEKVAYTLNHGNLGLYLPPMSWVDLIFEAEDSILAVLASAKYDENDYVRDRREFLRLAQI